MIDSENIFSSIKRGYTELNEATPSEIINYFETLDSKLMQGHISNIKGIVFEQEVVNSLNEHNINAALFDYTNHPKSDIAIIDDDGEIIAEFQLKATDSAAYIRQTLEENPDIPIITTSEIAQHFDNETMIIDSGISNANLTELVTNQLIDSDTSEYGKQIIETANECLADEVYSHIAEDSIVDGMLPIPVSPLGLLVKALLLLI